MAVTIHTSPQSYTPSDNPIKWEFSSDQTANVNFVYFVEVYVNGVLKGEHLIFTENGIYAKYDATDYASRFCDTPALTSTFDVSAGNNCEIYIKVYERYGTPPSLQASATSGTITAFKSSLSDADFIDWDYTDYAYATAKKWMSLFPRTERYFCGLTETMYLMYLTNISVGQFLEVELFDENDSLIIADSAGVSQNKITILKVDPIALMAATAGPITQAQFDQASYYEVWLDNGGGATEKFRIYIDRSCDMYNTKRFLFLSSIGSIESFSFTKATEETRDVKRYSFERNFGSWNTSNNFVYNLTDGREQDYLVTSSGKMSVSSDWIPEGLQQWLVRELYESPYVFVIISSVNRRCKVLNSTYKYKQGITDMIFNETIEIGLSDARKSVVV